jgi:hypothetical protein
MQEAVNPSILSVGVRVHSILHGGRDGVIFDVHGEQSPSTVRDLGMIVVGGSATFDVVFSNGTESRQIPESIVRGVQWRILPEQASADEIRAMRNFAAAEAMRKEQAQAEANARFRAEVAALRINPEYAHLQQTPALGGGTRLVAANIRAELKRSFNGAKFSVTSKGSTVRVRFTEDTVFDTVIALKKMFARFEEGSFDGMSDLYTHHTAPFNSVFGGVKYVFVTQA